MRITPFLTVLVISSSSFAIEPEQPQSVVATDAQVASVAQHAAWMMDALANEGANRTGASAELRALALEVKASNAAALSSLAKTLQQIHLEPAHSEMEDGFDHTAEKFQNARKALSGADYERSWGADTQRFAEAMSVQFDRFLIPKAKDKKLKAALGVMKAAFDAQLKKLPKPAH